jgi:hypothetical protein
VAKHAKFLTGEIHRYSLLTSPGAQHKSLKLPHFAVHNNNWTAKSLVICYNYNLIKVWLTDSTTNFSIIKVLPFSLFINSTTSLSALGSSPPPFLGIVSPYYYWRLNYHFTVSIGRSFQRSQKLQFTLLQPCQETQFFRAQHFLDK